MFQNVVEEMEQNGEELNRSIKIKGIFKDIFKYQNVIIYILTFFLSTIAIQNDVMPFGIAMLAACLGSTIPVVGVLIVSCIGNLVRTRCNSFFKLLYDCIYLFYISIYF